MNAVTGTDSDDWCVFDGVISVAENNGSVGVGGTNEMRGEGDQREREVWTGDWVMAHGVSPQPTSSL